MKIKEKVDRLIEFILIGIMSIMVINVTWQVFSRYVLNAPSPYTEELTRFLMIWIGLLGAAYISGKNAHISIDLFKEKFSKKKQNGINLFSDVLIILFSFFCFLIGGSRLVYITLKLGQLSPALQIPLAYVYFILPLTGLLIVFYKVLNILNKI